MKKECLRCEIEMKEVKQANAPSFIIEKKENDNRSVAEQRSGVNLYVCPNCGFLEFVAKKPEISS